MSEKYEQVPKSEYQPVKIEADRIIRVVQNDLRDHGVTFQPRLVGSGKRRMVTRVSGGNKGFDLDYNLILQRRPKDWDGKEIHYAFLESLRDALKGTTYYDPEESTSSFTIKFVDSKKRNIKHSIDIAVIFYDGDSMYYLRYNKLDKSFTFESRGERFDDRQYIKDIENYYDDGCKLILKEYLKLKNNNRDPDKRSFDLYTEAVKNIHNRMLQERKERAVQIKSRTVDKLSLYQFLASGGIGYGATMQYR